MEPALSVKPAILALPLLLASCAIPIQKTPPQIERLPAPLSLAGPAWAAQCEDWDEWNKPAPPVRLHGNSYLVGTCGIAAILVTGSKGHVLIDGGTADGAALIAANIRALGFRLEDVRLILHSHEHDDHVGGVAALQKMTGARLYASPVAAKVFETGAASGDDPQAGMQPPFPAARVDQIVKDGDVVRLGDLALKAHATPGHTSGALSWSWTACEAGCLSIVYADSLSPVSRDDYRFLDHPEGVAAFRRSIARVGALDCDVLTTPHPSASRMRDWLKAGALPLTGRDCATYATGLSERLDKRLAKEEAGQ